MTARTVYLFGGPADGKVMAVPSSAPIIIAEATRAATWLADDGDGTMSVAYERHRYDLHRFLVPTAKGWGAVWVGLRRQDDALRPRIVLALRISVAWVALAGH